jgi:HD-like signal output (HDOD) protein
MTMHLSDLLRQPHVLPTVPKVVYELMDSLNREDVAVEPISRSISADPVLSVKLLRLANSSYYHVSRSVSTVEDAVLMLGFTTVRTLVIGAGISGAFTGQAGVDLKRFWRYSTQTAAVARWLARVADCNQEQAFMVGLMHGLGHLVMQAGMPEQMLYLEKNCDFLDARRVDMEHASFGYHHAHVSAALFKAWKLPQELVDAVSYATEPLRAPTFMPLASILHVATWRARAQQARLYPEELAQTLPKEVCAHLKISPDQILQQMPKPDELAEELSAVFS